MENTIAQARALCATDIHLEREGQVWFRVQGRLQPAGLCSAADFAHWESLLSPGEERCDVKAGQSYSLATPETGRLRVHQYQVQGRPALALRLLPLEVPTLADLGLPAGVQEFGNFESGLVIVSGATGSGKTTTLAALLADIARRRPVHILTFEDPVEYQLSAGQGMIHQCSLGQDVSDYTEGVRSALRSDPDILMLGEMRDRATMKGAITMAETGHLVFTTLHASSAPDTLYRLLDAFPPTAQDTIRRQLAGLLQAVLYQKLLPGTKAGEQLPVCEILINTPGVANQIREGALHQLQGAMETGRAQGMQVLEEQLAQKIRQGSLHRHVACAASENPSRLARYLGETIDTRDGTK